MGATEEHVSETDEARFWQAEPFWNRLNRIESHHLCLQTQHEAVRRELASVRSARDAGFDEVWRRYCEVISELDRTSAELESLRTHHR